MPQTSPHGSSENRSSGYVLLEVLVALGVLGVAGLALLITANSCMRSAYRQTSETVRLVKDRNERAKGIMEDLAPR